MLVYSANNPLPMQSILTFWWCDEAAIQKWGTEGSILLQTQINVLPSAFLPSDDGKQTEKLRKYIW